MPAYLDHAATSPLRPEALDAVERALRSPAGNPTASHARGRAARRALDDARDALAAFVGVGPGELVLTSGATEADNLAVRGAATRGGGRVVCSAVEHPAVLHPAVAAGGTVVPVTSDGTVDLDALAGALAGDVALVSVMLVNNETGIVQPLDDVVDVVRRHAPGALVHTDAVQAAPWLDLPSAAAGADLVSISAHKFGGPPGVGALAVRGRAEVAAQIVGGGQERERRGGTPNLPGVVGAAAAAEATSAGRAAVARRVRTWRDRIVAGLTAVGGVHLAGGGRAPTVPGIVDVHIDGVESEALLFLLDGDGVCASAASSCASGALDPSHVLAAMGVSRLDARGSLRLSMGWSTTEVEVDRAIEAVTAAVGRIRAGSRVA